MSKKNLLSCIFLAVGTFTAVAYFYFDSKRDFISKDSPSEQTQPIASHSVSKESHLTPSSEESVKFSDENFIEPPESVRAFSSADKNDIWSNSQSASQSVPTQYSHLNNEDVERAFIEIERLQIESLNVGSSFNLAIPQTGNEFEAEVSNTVYHPNGDKTVKGIIEDNGETYSVTITQGKNSTFGTLSTPDGVYILEAGGTQGWLASKGDLLKLHDQSKSDAVLLTPDTGDIPPG